MTNLLLGWWISQETGIKQKITLISRVPAGIQPRQQCCEMVHHQMGNDGYLRNKFCILRFLSYIPSFTANACGNISEKMPMFVKMLVVRYSLFCKKWSCYWKFKMQKLVCTRETYKIPSSAGHPLRINLVGTEQWESNLRTGKSPSFTYKKI